jgi:probable F420-dependent oxidoreductase
MFRSVVLGISDFDALVPIAQAAEVAGYHRVWTTEGTERDAIVRAAAIASATDRIEVATGIAYAFSRSPLAVAATAADVSHIAGGRFALGLGAGTRGLRRRYGVEWQHPAPQFADYAQLIKAAFDPEAADSYEGRFYQADLTQFHRRTAPGNPRPKIYGSGVNRVMLTYCAAACDGVAVHSVATAPGYFEEVVVPALREGARRGGTTPELACWVIACVAEDGEAARRQARRQLAFYFSTPSYRTVAEAAGWGADVAIIQNLAREAHYSDWDSVAEAVPDEMVESLVIAGTPAEVSGLLPAVEARLAKGGADELVLQLVGFGETWEQVRDQGIELVRSCAPQ